ncbi:hypothetical protein DPMN_005804 [Dreissena polymorpha]|uniref:Uncharacterized protein n=1 Tax=Dreissena polymorpha TaxID=45954 RepID=A0A9D4MVC6_DREPO|nr:hypothetical protein DPMN_005804 [Dreissena polymorpha]
MSCLRLTQFNNSSGFWMANRRQGFISVVGLVAAEAATRTAISLRDVIWDMGLHECALSVIPY